MRHWFSFNRKRGWITCRGRSSFRHQQMQFKALVYTDDNVSVLHITLYRNNDNNSNNYRVSHYNSWLFDFNWNFIYWYYINHAHHFATTFLDYYIKIENKFGILYYSTGYYSFHLLMIPLSKRHLITWILCFFELGFGFYPVWNFNQNKTKFDKRKIIYLFTDWVHF